MLRSKFELVLKDLQEYECVVNMTKGKEYASGDEDALLNFKEIGALLELSPLKICMVYMFKHFKALCRYADIGYSESDEAIKSRVMDVRLYAALFQGLVEDEVMVVPVKPRDTRKSLQEELVALMRRIQELEE